MNDFAKRSAWVLGVLWFDDILDASIHSSLTVSIDILIRQKNEQLCSSDPAALRTSSSPRAHQLVLYGHDSSATAAST